MSVGETETPTPDWCSQEHKVLSIPVAPSQRAAFLGQAEHQNFSCCCHLLVTEIMFCDME